MAGSTKWSHFKSNGSMLDLFLLLAMSFAVLFMLAFILIKPVDPKKQDIELEEQLLVKLEWDDDMPNDLDLWIMAPNGEIISYRSKDKSSMILERDDLGTGNDWVMVDGERVIVPDNTEVARIKKLIDGSYYIGVHYYSTRGCERVRECNKQPFEVTVYDGQKHKRLSVFRRNAYEYAETPVAEIVVKEGKIVAYRKSTRQFILARREG